MVAHCEITGLDPDEDAVFDVALVRFVYGEPVERFCSFVDPRRAISAPVLRSCSISNLDVVDQPRLEELMPRLRAFAADDAIIAHDIGFAQASFGRHHRSHALALGDRAGAARVDNSYGTR